MKRNLARTQSVVLIGLLSWGTLGSSARADLSFLFSLDPASVPPEFNVDAGSFGRDPVDKLLAGRISTIFFSVDRVAFGAPGSIIRQQSQPPIESAHGDVYAFQFPGSPHNLVREEVDLGLDPGFLGDDLDALQVGGSKAASGSFPYTSPWRHSEFIGEPAVINGNGSDPDGRTADDIALGVSPLLFASGVLHIGLEFGDDLDALILMDVTPDASEPSGFNLTSNGIVDPGFDKAIFSLDPFSPNTFTGGNGPWGPGDLLFTDFDGSHELLVLAPDFQLNFADNVDALSIIPAPASGVLFIIALGLSGRCRRRNKRASVPVGPGMCGAFVVALLFLGPRHTFAGPPLPGDIDGNGLVDGEDIAGFVDAVIEGSNDPCTLLVFDIVPDGILDGADLTQLIRMLAYEGDPADLAAPPALMFSLNSFADTPHAAPATAIVPLGTTVQFEVIGVPPTVTVDWIGAVEVERGVTFSRAEVLVGDAGSRLVEVVLNAGWSCEWRASSRIVGFETAGVCDPNKPPEILVGEVVEDTVVWSAARKAGAVAAGTYLLVCGLGAEDVLWLNAVPVETKADDALAMIPRRETGPFVVEVQTLQAGRWGTLERVALDVSQQPEAEFRRPNEIPGARAGGIGQLQSEAGIPGPDASTGGSGPGDTCADLGEPLVFAGPSPPVTDSQASLAFRFDEGQGILCFTLSATHPAPSINDNETATDIVMPEQQAQEVAFIDGTPDRIVFTHDFVVPPGGVGAGSTVHVDCDILLDPYNRAVLDVVIIANEVPAAVRYLLKPLTVDMIIHKPKVIDAGEPAIPDDDELDKGAQTWVNLDNDDQDSKYDTGTTDTDVAGEDEMSKVILRLKPNTLKKGKVKLQASAGAGNIKVWNKANKDSEYTLGTNIAVTSFVVNGDFLELPCWVEGISPHTAQQETKIKMTYDQAPAKTDEVALTIIGIDKIEWQGRNNSVNDNNTLDADPNWPGGVNPGSVRVFPGARIVGGAVEANPRDTVDVKVTLTVEPVEAIKVYFDSFDVDDPTSATSPVDDSAGNETSDEDNRGTTPAKSGKFVQADGTSDETGGIKEEEFTDKTATFRFQTTLQPGDNFRVVGSGDKDFLVDLENKDSDFAGNNNDKQRIVNKHVTGSAAQREIRNASNYASDKVLTVWRRLHVELDSMGAPNATAPAEDLFGVVTDSDASGSTTLTATVLTDGTGETWQPNDQLIGAEVDPDTGDANAEAFEVTDSNATSVTVKIGGKALGLIRLLNVAAIADGETFTIGDGGTDGAVTNTKFEFDTGDGVVAGNVAVAIPAPMNTETLEANMVAAINGVAALGVTAAPFAAISLVVLLNDNDGSAGNVAIAETVTDGNFTPAGMNGGLGPNSLTTNGAVGDPYSIDTDDVNPGNLGDSNTALATMEYRGAYVEFVDDLGATDDDDEVTFVRNVADANAAAIGNGVRDVDSVNRFWVIQVFTAYEGERSEDADRNFPNEAATMGFSPGPCLIYHEVIRDVPASVPGFVGQATLEKRIVLHETLHRFAVGHGTEGIMSAFLNIMGTNANNELNDQQKDIVRDQLRPTP